MLHCKDRLGTEIAVLRWCRFTVIGNVTAKRTDLFTRLLAARRQFSLLNSHDFPTEFDRLLLAESSPSSPAAIGQKRTFASAALPLLAAQ